MKTMFKIKYTDSLGDKYSECLIKDVTHAVFEKDIVECIALSNNQKLISKPAIADYIIELMVTTKGYESAYLSYNKYILDDNCPLPDSVFLSRKDVQWEIVK